jgi:hypothetical protein
MRRRGPISPFLIKDFRRAPGNPEGSERRDSFEVRGLIRLVAGMEIGRIRGFLIRCVADQVQSRYFEFYFIRAVYPGRSLILPIFPLYLFIAEGVLSPYSDHVGQLASSTSTALLSVSAASGMII